MKRRIMFSLMAALALSSAVMAPAQADDDFGSYTVAPAEITEIYDGDTIFLDNPAWPAFAGHHIGVRLKGDDSPERHSHCAVPAAKAAEEAKAMQARQLLVTTIQGGKVIELHHVGRDKYFRILAELWVDGKNVSDLLIGQGLAVSYHGEKKVGWCGSSPVLPGPDDDDLAGVTTTVAAQ